MATCSFCKKNYSEHKGVVIFTNDGRTLSYCSSKCRNNANLGRDPKKVNWIRKREDMRKIREDKEKAKRAVLADKEREKIEEKNSEKRAAKK